MWNWMSSVCPQFWGSPSESEGFRIQNDCGDWNNHYQILKPSQKKIRAAVSMLASMVKV